MGTGPTPNNPREDLLLGRVISERYRVLRKLGEGGMGSVYLAEHVLIEKKLALKVMFPDLLRRSDIVTLFLQEARSASRIEHENVIDISDFGQSPEGLVFIAMEYLDGISLAQALRSEGPFPWERAHGIAEQICRGLRAAHAHGVVHRDVKPENIFLIRREDHPEFVKILDFGIAKVVGQASGLTQTGVVFGTPEYMAPEQALGEDTDHRVDIYSVGCILYQMLTGQAPFKADSMIGVLAKHTTEPPVPPRELRPELDVPADAEEIVLTAMQKNRDDRYPDMGAMLAALDAASTSPAQESAMAPIVFEPIPEPQGTSRLTWIVLAVLALAGAAVGLLILRTTGGHPTRLITEPARAIRGHERRPPAPEEPLTQAPPQAPTATLQTTPPVVALPPATAAPVASRALSSAPSPTATPPSTAKPPAALQPHPKPASGPADETGSRVTPVRTATPAAPTEKRRPKPRPVIDSPPPGDPDSELKNPF